MTRDTRISLIIPAYKPEGFRACLKSCLEQTLAADQIIVSDDSVDDRIRQTVADLSGEREIVYRRNRPGLGLPANYLVPLAKARGGWIKYVDDDDELLPDCLERLAARLAPNVSLALGGYLERGQRGRRMKSEPGLDAINDGRQILLSGRKLLFFSRMLVRRDVMDSVAGEPLPSPLLGLDRIVGFRACLMGDIAWEKEPVCVYSRHEAGESVSTDPDVLWAETAGVDLTEAYARRVGGLGEAGLQQWRQETLADVGRFILRRLVEGRRPVEQARFIARFGRRYPGMLSDILTPRMLRRMAGQIVRPWPRRKYRRR
jgi:glycosyltransferase involved in cell wall biosynthesis